MLAEHLSCQADCLIGSQGSVGVYIQCKLVEISTLTYTGIFYRNVNSLYRCIDRINGNYADW